MQELHPAQKRLLEILKKNSDEPLSVRKIQEIMEVSSPSVVQHHIKQLEKKGYLRRNPLNPKDYQILAESPDKQVTFLNLYGLAQCGPNGSVFDGDPIERVPISSKILGFPSSEAFMVKAKGDSMTPRIHEKDLVIARKINHADNGSIVVCVNNGETLIKKIQKENGVILVSLNSKYPPFVANEDFRVEGVVKGVYSYEISNV
ncbi:HTH domain-containing protein [Candidatus Gracilibacteria bacterium]|nr:HTH domain-containing protein [Candidatus Gracilibacteria bacterium]